MKKPLMVLAALIGAAVLVRAAAVNGPVTYVDHEKVSKGGALATAPAYTVSVLTRNKAGQVEVHTKETDIFYIMDGEATFVTGGTMIGGKTTAPNQLRGTEIKGGESRRLAKGDVIVIPAGTPHWFKEVPASVKYFTVKSIKP